MSTPVTRERTLRDLLEEAMRAGAGHQHWDHTMQHGAGCGLCIERRDANERIRTALAALDGTQPQQHSPALLDRLREVEAVIALIEHEHDENDEKAAVAGCSLRNIISDLESGPLGQNPTDGGISSTAAQPQQEPLTLTEFGALPTRLVRPQQELNPMWQADSLHREASNLEDYANECESRMTRDVLYGAARRLREVAISMAAQPQQEPDALRTRIEDRIRFLRDREQETTFGERYRYTFAAEELERVIGYLSAAAHPEAPAKQEPEAQ